MDRWAAGSRALVLVGGACLLSGFVARGFYEYEHESTRAPALALYVPPAGLPQVAVPGAQAGPVAAPTAMTPIGYPESPASQMPAAQMPIGKPSMDATPQAMLAVPAVDPRTQLDAFIHGPLQGFFWGLAASFAIGAAIMKKKLNDDTTSATTLLNNAEDRLELGMLPGRAAARCPAPTMKVKGLVGDCAPLGYFDPLGLSKDASPETMKKWREAELKHGRVAMLAAAGMITADGFHPLFGGKLSSNPLLAATQIPKLGWIQIFTFIMFMEVIGILNSRRPDYEPGNFLGTSQWETDANWDSYQTKELNNGRLAMFGSIGMLVGAYITGKGPIEALNSIDTIIS